MNNFSDTYEYKQGIDYINYLDNQYFSDIKDIKNKKYKNIETKLNVNLSTIKKRLMTAKKINKKFEEINFKNGSNKCVNNEILKHTFFIRVIGRGSFGSVKLANFKYTDIKYAIKETRGSSSIPISRNITSDDIIEIKYLFNDINPLIESRKTPGLPYTYNYFLCNSCNILISSSKLHKKYKCGVLCSELGSGDLTVFDNNYKSLPTSDIDNILFNIYFQLMYSLAVFHHYTGILHNDIKDTNILYYSVPVGGYWKYIINDKVFYLPNLGFIIILNDFGVSQYIYPKKIIKTTNWYNYIGYGIIDNNNDFQITIPLIKKRNLKGQSNINIYKEYLNKLNINIDDIEPNKYISVTYGYDVIDVIYTFCGGKQTTQHGNHSVLHLYEKSYEFKKMIKKLLTINKTTENKNWKNTNSLIYKRLNKNTLKKYENPLYISALYNLLYIYKDMYLVPPINENLLEIYKFY
jgi:serine/threonine protein kinase